MTFSKEYTDVTGFTATDRLSFAIDNSQLTGIFNNQEIQDPYGSFATLATQSDEALNAFNIAVYGQDGVVDEILLASNEELISYFNTTKKKETNKQIINASSPSSVATIKNYARPKGIYSPTMLAYPYDIDLDQDHLKISQYEYKRPDVGGNPNRSKAIQASKPNNAGGNNSVSEKGKPYGKYTGGVILPMPKVSDSNGAEWGKSDLSVFGLGLASVLGTGADALTGSNISQLLNKVNPSEEEGDTTNASILAGEGNPDQLQNLRKALGAGLGNIADTGRATLGVAAEQVGRAAGIDLSADEFLARSTGRILNPNAELLFQGPVLRDFAFKFLLIARSPEEGEVIRKIIKFFKTGAAPIFQTSALLQTPNIFKLEYKRGTTLLPTVNQFNEMALRTITVDYAPDGFWSAYQDSQPVAVVMNLQFSELKPIYKSDQDGTGDSSVGY